ncbi:MAG TPA: M20/M25/M40 family metallo-hydrolase [Microbacterium sp.]|nr:M20/M25/M40 family metallo-hydrolase [Microbacterium sp.]
MPADPTPATENLTPRPGVAERLSRMIQLPTVSAELDSRGAQPFEDFVTLLAELYPVVHERLELERVTEFGLLFRWAGAAASAQPVVLMAHYDVVPVDESDAWTHPPFEGLVEDGWVYGRGALDDKGPLLVVLEAVENLLLAGFTPARDVYLSFGGNEETYGAAAQEVATTLRERGIVPWLVLDEGGAVVDAPLPFALGSAAMVGVGEKGVVTLQLSARGDGGHASAPPRITAVGRIARAIDRLDAGTFAARTPAAITRMLSLFANKARGRDQTVLRTLATFPALTARIFAAMGGEPAALVRTTVAATMQQGGTAANVLPSQASATINLRIALGETAAGTVRRVRRRIHDPLVEISVVESSDPSPESPTDNAQFGLISAAVKASYPDAATVPFVCMAATDSRHFHRFAPAVYRFAPLAMSNAQRASVHGVDERVEIASLEKGELFHRALLQRLQ